MFFCNHSVIFNLQLSLFYIIQLFQTKVWACVSPTLLMEFVKDHLKRWTKLDNLNVVAQVVAKLGDPIVPLVPPLDQVQLLYFLFKSQLSTLLRYEIEFKWSWNELIWNASIYFLINKLKFTGLLYIIYKIVTVVNADQKGDHSISLWLIKESGHLMLSCYVRHNVHYLFFFFKFYFSCLRQFVWFKKQ